MPVLGIVASSQQSAFVSTVAYDSISTVTVGSGGSAEVNFTSIPATYKHLQIRIFGKLSITNDPQLENVRFQFNGDTASNYTRHAFEGDGASVTSTGNASLGQNYALLPRSFSGTTNMFGNAIVDILDYTNTNKFKTQRVFGGADFNGSGQVYLLSGVWRNTSAISSIKIFNFGATNFLEYSSFALYGIKG
jgi:hypothetical protein